jgi:hypothetical protein
MEDAMVVYRLVRAPERRVFYVDVGQLPPFKAEAFIDRIKDQFRKRKTTSNSGTGANQVEERWMPPAQDEDYWLPIRLIAIQELKLCRGLKILAKLMMQFISEINYSPHSIFLKIISIMKMLMQQELHFHHKMSSSRG